MADDMTEKIMNILNNPEMMKELTKTIGKMNTNPAPDPTFESSQNTEDFVLKAGQIIDSLNTTSDRRINLLNALKPYLRESRASGVDKAIKMLKVTKLTDAFKNERS